MVSFQPDCMTKETVSILSLKFSSIDSNIPTAPAYGVHNSAVTGQ
jgi:hypothetical protein